jgi:hypothetical protein
MAADSAKKLKRGEVLFKEGEANTAVYIVQSGKVALTLERSGRKVEITTLGPSSVIGEQALFSTAKNLFSAEASSETKVLEVPVDVMKTQFAAAAPGIKLLVKSMSEEVKGARNTLKNIKLEGDKSPMPQALIPRTFTFFHIVARHLGKRKDPEKPNHIEVNWGTMRMYLNRFFGEPQARYRSIVDLLVKLKLATIKMDTNEDGVEELGVITIPDIMAIEDFSEFYQYHLFKGAKAEAIYVDQVALKAAKAIVALSEGAPVNHKGASTVDFGQLTAKCKTDFKFDLKSTHMDIMEKKGLFAQRKPHDDGSVSLIFDRPEFVKMAAYWSIIFEIDKWNERGQVELVEKEEAAAGGAMACGQCQGPITENAKFCPSCGFKIAA